MGDASRLDELAPLAAVVSCFGLQQMPQQAQVLAHWTRALSPGQLPACNELDACLQCLAGGGLPAMPGWRGPGWRGPDGLEGWRVGSFCIFCLPAPPWIRRQHPPSLHPPQLPARRSLAAGGVLCVCFWPQAVEDSGPWQRLAQLTAPSRPQPDWEADIPGAALREGAELLQVSRHHAGRLDHLPPVLSKGHIGAVGLLCSGECMPAPASHHLACRLPCLPRLPGCRTR